MASPILPETRPDILVDTPVSPVADAITTFHAVTDQASVLRDRYPAPYVNLAISVAHRAMTSSIADGVPVDAAGLEHRLSTLQRLYADQATVTEHVDSDQPTGGGMLATIGASIQNTREMIAEHGNMTRRSPLIPPRLLPPVRYALALEARFGSAGAMAAARDLRARTVGTYPWMAGQARRAMRGMAALAATILM